MSKPCNCSYDEELDVEDLTLSSHKKTAKLSTCLPADRSDEPLTYPLVLQDELTDNTEIYHLWMRTFSEDSTVAEQKWEKFCKKTKERCDEFDKKLKKIETDTYIKNENDVFFDVGYLHERMDNVDNVLGEIEKYNKEFSEITKLLEKFCQYLPKDVYRKRVDLALRNLRVRYFNLVQGLQKKREILRWVIPRFQAYRNEGGELKKWLDHVESHSKPFLSVFQNSSSILEKREDVEKIADEINAKRDSYEDFLNAGNGILDIDHNMKMTHLEEDLEDVACRWDFLCEKIENCLRIIFEEENKSSDVNSSDTDKIDRHIRDEYQQCTCCKKFSIEKVEDGRYTFGSTKTIRLLRIHGNSIVVRVGGGWEYLYNFLYKVDPCRAKQLATDPEKAIKRIKYLSGVSLIPADQQDTSFTMSVQRMYRTSWVPIKNRIGSSFSKKLTVSADNLDSAGDSLSSLSTTSSSSTSSIPHAVDKQSKQSKEPKKIIPSGRYNSLSAGSSGSKNKLNKSTGNLNKKPFGRRVSLMERQSLYRRKRCPSSASVLDH